MSRLGKKPIMMPKGTTCTISEENVTVKGPKGELTIPVMKGVHVAVEEDNILVSLKEALAKKTQFQGLFRSLINNMVIGVTQGFSKKLELKGVGFRAAVQGNVLNCQLGFSHPTKMEIPQGITVKVDANVNIEISGIDKRKVGQFAADLHHLRKPEPYKGKGVHYVGRYTRRKAGKAAAKK